MMKALVIGIMCLVLVFLLAGYHIRYQPTADELYGCTVAQQAPNGECQ